MPIGKGIPPTGRKITLELNEFEASKVAGALSLYADTMVKVVVLLSSVGEKERAEKMKDLMTPEIDRVVKIMKAIDADDGNYSSEVFDIPGVQKQMDEFQAQTDAMEFIMSDGKDGKPMPREGNVVDFPQAFQKKKLH
jgi:hypothetical protein